MFSVALILLLTAGSCVHCIDLIQPDSEVVQPGQSLTITCRPSGYSVTDNSYATGWIRHRQGKPMEWIFHMWGGGSLYQNDALKNKFSYSRDTSAGTVTITGQSLQPEDTAVYYCVRYKNGLGNAFDYWGQGTEVTVSSETSSSPTLFPLTPCDSESGDYVTFGCLAQDFFPKGVTFQWTNAGKTKVASDQYIFPQNNANNRFTGVSVISVPRSEALSYNCSLTHPTGEKSVQVGDVISPPHVTLLSVPEGDKQVLVCSIKDFAPKQLSVSWKKNNNIVTGFSSFNPQKSGAVYSAVSILKVDKTDWDKKAVYTCGVTHKGQNYEKKASKAPITVKLSPPSPKAMFSNKKAELKCVVTGQDGSILSSTTVNWYINGQQVTNGITDGSNSGEKYSTLTRNLAEWKKVNTVSCSATINDMTPVTQSLTIKQENQDYKVKVLMPSQSNDTEVTLVCLVTSPKEQDYYIAWSESSGHNSGTFIDGITLPTQKINNSYLVSSLYTITKKKWEGTDQFSCNVWPAGRENASDPQSVSKYSGCTGEDFQDYRK